MSIYLILSQVPIKATPNVAMPCHPTTQIDQAALEDETEVMESAKREDRPPKEAVQAVSSVLLSKAA